VDHCDLRKEKEMHSEISRGSEMEEEESSCTQFDNKSAICGKEVARSYTRLCKTKISSAISKRAVTEVTVDSPLVIKRQCP